MLNLFEPTFDMFEPAEEEEEKKRQNPLMALMKGYQQPERPKLDAYSQMLENIPQREDYKMSTGGKVGSALVAGLAGLTAKSGQDAAKFGMELRDRPYKQALDDFSLEAKGAAEAAKLEAETISSREKVYEQMFEMQDKIQDNDRLDKDTSVRHFRAKTMDAYLKDKAKRDSVAAEHKAKMDERRTAATEKSASAATSRAAAYGRKIDHSIANPTKKSPTESSKVTAKKQAMDYLGAVNPTFNNFIQRDDYGNIIGYNPKKAAADPEGFEDFVRQVEQMQAQSLMGEPDEDPDILGEFEEE